MRGKVSKMLRKMRSDSKGSKRQYGSLTHTDRGMVSEFFRENPKLMNFSLYQTLEALVKR